MFLFKKIVAPLFFPVPLCLQLLLAGCVLLWWTSRQRLGKIFISSGLLLLLLLSNTWLADRLLIPLEQRFVPLRAIPASEVKWVIVLGGGNSGELSLPATMRLSQGSMMRLIEGIRIHKEIPGSKLLLSGGSVFGSLPDAGVMAQVAESIDVKREDIVMESRARDTEEEAKLIKPMIKSDRFILVTSASHMPRSVELFRKYGMAPIPAPTDYLVKRDTTVSPSRIYPNSGALGKAEKVFHEYLGLAWAELRL